MITTRQSNYLHSFTINTKDFDGNSIVYHKSTMDHLSKVNYIWSSVVKYNLLQLQNYGEEFIFPLKHHMQSTESGVQYISTCLATVIS